MTPLQVLAMGVDAGAKKGSKEGLIFTLEFDKFEKREKTVKKRKTQKMIKNIIKQQNR